MTEPSDNCDPTEADLDLILEDATGKPVEPENLAAGIASLQERIAQLEKEKTKLLGQLEKADGSRAASINPELVALNRQIAAARQRLRDYESQTGQQN